MKFLADDGKVFDDIEDCKDYEKEIAIIKKLNNRHYRIPYGDSFVEFFDIKHFTDLEIMEEYCCEQV